MPINGASRRIEATAEPSDQCSPLLNKQQAAEILGLKVATLSRWRWAGRGRIFLKIGPAVRSFEVFVASFVDAARWRSTSDHPDGLEA